MNIFRLSDINYDNIQIIYPEKLTSNLNICNIKYKGKRFITQTPKTQISSFPFLFNNQNNYRLVIQFNNYQSCHKTQLFIKTLLNLEKYIQQFIPIINNKLNIFGKNKFISSIKFNKDKTKAFMTLNIQQQFNKPLLSIYDCDREPKNIDIIEIGIKTINLIYLKNIWIKNNMIGLNWVILQSKVYPDIIKLDKCLIDEEDNIDNIINIDIPQFSIEQPIISPPNINPKIPIPPPPPPPANINLIIENKTISTPSKNTSNNLSNNSSNTSSGTVFLPPSASELQNMIGRLKKINKE